MYRECLECNNGKGMRLKAGEVSCPHDHSFIVCIFQPGDTVGDFLIEELLPAGEGGYATVYRASPLVAGFGPSLGSSVVGGADPYPPEVALKVALAHRRGAVEREAEVLSSLQDAHLPSIPRIYPISPDHQAPTMKGGTGPGSTDPFIGRMVADLEQFYYMVLEFLPGGSLRDRLEARSKNGKGLGVGVARQVVREVGEALMLMHSRGWIHLDVKPANIMFNGQNRGVLIDYGITVHEEGEETSWAGTAPYAPREQINQDYPDGQADIHALGITAFEVMTGVLPYRGSSATMLSSSVMSSRPFKLGHISGKLGKYDEGLLPAIEPEIEERYKRVEQFMDAFSPLPKGELTAPLPRIVARNGRAGAAATQVSVPARSNGSVSSPPPMPPPAQPQDWSSYTPAQGQTIQTPTQLPPTRPITVFAPTPIPIPIPITAPAQVPPPEPEPEPIAATIAAPRPKPAHVIRDAPLQAMQQATQPVVNSTFTPTLQPAANGETEELSERELAAIMADYKKEQRRRGSGAGRPVAARTRDGISPLRYFVIVGVALAAIIVLLGVFILPRLLNQIVIQTSPSTLEVGKLAMDLLEPAVGQSFVGDDLPVLRWKDPNGGLASNERYRIILERPDGSTEKLTSNDSDIHLGRDKLGATGGQFKWQVVRIRLKGKDPALDDVVISYNSGSRAFLWYEAASPTPTPTVTYTPAPTDTPAPPTNTRVTPPTATPIAQTGGGTAQPTPTKPVVAPTTTRQGPQPVATNTIPPQPNPTNTVPRPPTNTRIPVAPPTAKPVSTNTQVRVEPTATRVIAQPTATNAPVLAPTNTPTLIPVPHSPTNIPAPSTPTPRCTPTGFQHIDSQKAALSPIQHALVPVVAPGPLGPGPTVPVPVPPTEVPEPTEEPPPTETQAPPPTDTRVPPPTDTPMPPPTNTRVPCIP